MPRKIKLTRPELKRWRSALQRYQRYLPMLKLKQQQLQMTVREVAAERREAAEEADDARRKMDPYRAVLSDPAGVDVAGLARPVEVKTVTENIAGVRVPALESVAFAPADYSLFGTPPWVDATLADLREHNRRLARLEVLARRLGLLSAALTKVIQRVNLFEKVLIPEAREAIRVIRIHLGEEQTAGVARAKLAKAKLQEAPAGAAVAAGAGPEGGP